MSQTEAQGAGVMAADIPAANDAIAHEPARPRHHLVSPPKYIRTQSIGLLSRSKTLSSSLNSAPAIPIPLDDKRHRRTSVPFPSAENEVLPGPPQRPLKRRSDSLPAFPADQPQPVARLRPANDTGIPRERKSMLFEYGQPCAISELPSDPKTWTPSQLSVYLAHVLKLVPKAVQADVMRFVVKSGLTGKRFLRMRDEDLVVMGLNISWCRIFSTARERLRKEALRGRIFGTTSPSRSTASAEDDCDLPRSESDIMSLFLRPPRSADEALPNQQWKQNSWRRKEGKKSRGRVKGIAKVFEEGEADNATLTRSDSFKRQEEIEEVRRVRRMRGSSTDSESSQLSSSSVESGYSFSEAQAQLLDRQALNAEGLEQPTTPTNESRSMLGDATIVDWSSIEPLTLEDTSALPAQFLTQEAQDALPPPTPIDETIYGLPGLPETEEEASFTFLNATTTSEGSHTPSIIVDPVSSGMEQPPPAEEAGDLEQKMAPMPFADEKYQSRILAHGREAYSPISRRGSTSSYFPKLPLPGSPPSQTEAQATDAALSNPPRGSTLSEMTDELSEEHLAFWIADQRGQSQRTSASHASGLPKSSSDPLIVETAGDGAGSMLFAEAEGEKKLTVKRLDSNSSRTGSGRPRSHSNDNFGSLRMSSIISRTSGKSRKTADLRTLFAEKEGSGQTNEEDEIIIRMKGRREEEVVVMSRTELEQMQSKLRDLEIRLAASESQHSRTSTSDERSLTAAEKTQAMTTWVRDALGEANTYAGMRAGRDTSWIGLRGWALAAGLGVGIVVGEAVLGKLRR